MNLSCKVISVSARRRACTGTDLCSLFTHEGCEVTIPYTVNFYVIDDSTCPNPSIIMITLLDKWKAASSSSSAILRRRLVVSVAILLSITILQLGLFHWKFAIEERETQNDPIRWLVSQNQKEKQSLSSSSSPEKVTEVESVNVLSATTTPSPNDESGTKNEQQPELPLASSTLPNKEVREEEVPPPPPFRFDVLVRQYPPDPKFPPDYAPTGTPVIDILKDTNFDVESLRPLNLTLRTGMLGLLVDGGRHFFPVPWLKRLLHTMNILQYNILHLRLTDDQAFAIRLDSHPNLTCQTNLYGSTGVYTRDDIQELVEYARGKGISIIPEINVPGHAGAWMGIPGLVVPCKYLACSKGYGLPLNASHPNLRGILTDVIREVITVFQDPLYLHLGGDEIEMSKPCFDEVGQEFFDYNIFESMLKDILEEVGYPEERVIRWRRTDLSPEQQRGSTRAGHINHWWHDTPGKTENVTAGTPIFGSCGLYMDVNDMHSAWDVFLHSRKWWHLSDVFAQNAPINLLGLIVGTFELSVNFFHDRNVVGRMLAVTIGVSDLTVQRGNEVNEIYGKLCHQANFPNNLCRKYGSPVIEYGFFKHKWSVMWQKFKDDMCKRFP